MCPCQGLKAFSGDDPAAERYLRLSSSGKQQHHQQKEQMSVHDNHFFDVTGVPKCK